MRKQKVKKGEGHGLKTKMEIVKMIKTIKLVIVMQMMKMALIERTFQGRRWNLELQEAREGQRRGGEPDVAWTPVLVQGVWHQP